MMNTAETFFFHFFFSFVATATYAILNNAPRRELWACGLCGAAGWVVYYFVDRWTGSVTGGVFLGAVVATFLTRVFSYTHRAPSTLYLVPGVVPLVPGSQIYRTMEGILEDNIYHSFVNAVLTLKLAGVIAIGIMIVFTLPSGLFTFITPKEGRDNAPPHKEGSKFYQKRKHPSVFRKNG